MTKGSPNRSNHLGGVLKIIKKIIVRGSPRKEQLKQEVPQEGSHEEKNVSMSPLR